MNKPREFWIEKSVITDNIHAAVLTEPKWSSSPVGTIQKSNVYHAIEKTPEVAKAVNRDHLFEKAIGLLLEANLALPEVGNFSLKKDIENLFQRAKAAK